MDHINELKISINTQEQQVKDLNELKNKVYEKAENARKTALAATCLGGVGHLILGPLIHPFISVASLIFMLCVMTPSAIIMMRNEDKEEKYKKEINQIERSIEKQKEELENLTNETLNQIPIAKTNITSINPFETNKKENQITNNKKM